MRIVVLDGYTLNPGDLSWETLEQLGPCAIHDRTPAAEVVARAGNADIVLTNKTVLGRESIYALPRLRYIGVLATGINVVDAQAARERGIPVTNVPNYGSASVAQMVFAHILNFTQHVAGHADSVRRGDWSRSADFCYWTHPLVELSGRTLGIIGFGPIGREVARLAAAFRMRILVNTRQRRDLDFAGAAWTDRETLFRESDFITLHCPLTPETKHIVNADTLARVKKSAFLVNTGRGALIDESALAAALADGRLAGAGLDVLSDEPPKRDHPLVGDDRCFITPHIAWATRDARQRLLAIAVDNVRAFLAGRPVHVVNG